MAPDHPQPRPQNRRTGAPEHLAAILATLRTHKAWLTTAVKTADIHDVQPLTVRPILVLTGESDAQQRGFYDTIPVGGDLLLFGSAHTNEADPMAPPSVLQPEPANNYRRWWNNPWKVVEASGQSNAGDWTPASDARLRALVDHAHAHHLWIRFYTLDGAPTPMLSSFGWFRGYNFGSLEAVQQRWRAALRAGVDYIASDQYEALHKFLGKCKISQETTTNTP